MDDAAPIYHGETELEYDGLFIEVAIYGDEDSWAIRRIDFSPSWLDPVRPDTAINRLLILAFEARYRQRLQTDISEFIKKETRNARNERPSMYRY